MLFATPNSPFISHVIFNESRTFLFDLYVPLFFLYFRLQDPPPNYLGR